MSLQSFEIQAEHEPKQNKYRNLVAVVGLVGGLILTACSSGSPDKIDADTPASSVASTTSKPAGSTGELLKNNIKNLKLCTPERENRKANFGDLKADRQSNKEGWPSNLNDAILSRLSGIEGPGEWLGVSCKSSLPGERTVRQWFLVSPNQQEVVWAETLTDCLQPDAHDELNGLISEIRKMDNTFVVSEKTCLQGGDDKLPHLVIGA